MGRASEARTGRTVFRAAFIISANSPIEMCEVLFPITFTDYGFIPGSGGDGQHRGGLGLGREWRLDADWGVVSGSFERFRHGPYGLNGGAAGSKGRFVHFTDGGRIRAALEDFRRPARLPATAFGWRRQVAADGVIQRCGTRRRGRAIAKAAIRAIEAVEWCMPTRRDGA